MTNEELQTEVDELRTELVSMRQAEILKLQNQLTESQRTTEHYRNEAMRNAELGRKIAADYQQELIELRMQLKTATKTEAYEKRNVRK